MPPIRRGSRARVYCLLGSALTAVPAAAAAPWKSFMARRIKKSVFGLLDCPFVLHRYTYAGLSVVYTFVYIYRVFPAPPLFSSPALFFALCLFPFFPRADICIIAHRWNPLAREFISPFPCVVINYEKKKINTRAYNKFVVKQYIGLCLLKDEFLAEKI